MKHLEDMTEPELRDLLRRCGDALKGVLGTKSMWVLLVFDDPAVAQYIATCERASVIEAMRETADRLERNMDVTRAGTPRL